MLEVCTTTLPSPSKDHHVVGFTDGNDDDCFAMVVDDNDLLLDYIDFSSCCDVVPSSFFDADGDILPDLEVDPTEELLAEFEEEPPANSASACHHHHHDETTKPSSVVEKESPSAVIGGGEGEVEKIIKDDKKRLLLLQEEEEDGQKKKKKKKKRNTKGEDIMMSAVTTTEDDDSAEAGSSSSSASAEGQSKKKTSKSSHGLGHKKKVDWTPELHRKFVQAVEQLGIDKAVPSRILEIMGIECLTRHNIASHLQKYRSHRKHLMAREAEAATWAHKRHMYAAAAASTGVAPPPPGRTTAKQQDMVPAPAYVNVWPPTIGFPPPPFGRPLHVWGHPPTTATTTMDPLLPPVWPRHLAPPPPLRPAWVDPAAAYWHHHQQQQFNAARKWGPQAVTQGTPCVPLPPPPPAAMLPRFPPAPVPGMMPMYRPAMMIPPPQTATGSRSKLASLQLQLDAHPSKESIDAAIGDVLVKPWLPLPLGLKPPSMDSVMSELHKQGIPSIPPPATT